MLSAGKRLVKDERETPRVKIDVLSPKSKSQSSVKSSTDPVIGFTNIQRLNR